jgi:molybdopterin/thiamine biosynthesis adenylyltransferase
MKQARLIEIEKQALEKIKELAAEAISKRLETGGFLVGHYTDDGARVFHAIGPGPNANRSAACFEPDYLHAGQELEKLNKQGSFKIVGGWHWHSVDGLSHGDQRTLMHVCGERPGFLALVACGRENKIRVFGVENRKIVEKAWEVFEHKEECVFARISGLLSTTFLTGKKVVVFGLGSGGSTATKYLAYAGIKNFVLADDENFEEVNRCRHVGKFYQVGMPKVEVVASELRLINPAIKIHSIRKRLTQETASEFEALVKKSHLVLACSGNASANRLLNEICLRQRKPVIFAGVFAKAEGGFVLQSVPYLQNSPCLNCIFEHAKHAQDESNEAREHMARDYGMSAEELSAQQGLYIDISFVALLQAKMALLTLLRGTRHSLPKLPGNLVVWNSQTMNARWAKVGKRKDCSVCNPEEWLKSRKLQPKEKSDDKAH